MLIYPAIDLFEGKAVRLFKGDYRQMTVYSENPPEIAEDFASKGATHMHIVDLEGAKDGTTDLYARADGTLVPYSPDATPTPSAGDAGGSTASK